MLFLSVPRKQKNVTYDIVALPAIRGRYIRLCFMGIAYPYKSLIYSSSNQENHRKVAHKKGEMIMDVSSIALRCSGKLPFKKNTFLVIVALICSAAFHIAVVSSRNRQYFLHSSSSLSNPGASSSSLQPPPPARQQQEEEPNYFQNNTTSHTTITRTEITKNIVPAAPPLHQHQSVTFREENKESCLVALNSKDWLQNPRYGNIPSNFSQHFLFFSSSSVVGGNKGNLLDHLLQDLLDHQTICHEKSLFKSLEETVPGGDDASGGGAPAAPDETALFLRIWKIRLMYMAFYFHQHEHAINEARDRENFNAAIQNDIHNRSCQHDLIKYNLSTFDYECRDAKLIVAEVRNTGIGSLIKRDLFNVFMAGIALNRTVVLYNGLQKDAFYSYPWQLSSCPRHDYQCTFRPVSGCAPLIEDIFNATPIDPDEIEQFLNQRHHGATLDESSSSIVATSLLEEETSRIIRYVNPAKKTLNISPKFLARMNSIAHSIIDKMDQGDERIPVLRKAAEAILSDKGTKNFYKFEHEHSDAMISFIMYFLRPREDKAKLLEEFLQKDLPRNFDSTRTLGLPFRGSDKCNQESECLSFPTYMNLLKSRWLEAGFHKKFGGGREGGDLMDKNNLTANIVVTSEVPNIMELAHDFSTNDLYRNKLPFHVNWITNTNDVHQGNGSTKRPVLTHGATADDILLSILSSFKLQMNTALTVGNCCSNFHQTIFHLLRGGCGLHIDNVGQCLQERNESIYQLCCDVKSGRSCVAQRLDRLRKEYNDENITVQGVEMKLWEE